MAEKLKPDMSLVLPDVSYERNACVGATYGIAAPRQGAFVAPFDETHGWYWRNRGDQPVVVKLKVSGFYQTLYRPK
ncbi:MAG: hypothetical protein ACYCY2_13730 [Acidithiobacillus ferriphilus]